MKLVQQVLKTPFLLKNSPLYDSLLHQTRKLHKTKKVQCHSSKSCDQETTLQDNRGSHNIFTVSAHQLQTQRVNHLDKFRLLEDV